MKGVVTMSSNIKTLASTLVAAIALTGCASGSALVTGEKRSPVDPEAVKIYLESPREYETIGVIEASSDSGWTKQGDLDYATKELKKQAGKLGANGVLLQSRGSKTSGSVAVPAGNIWIAVPSEEQSVSGLAIWVPNTSAD
jgi:hypothetical protein